MKKIYVLFFLNFFSSCYDKIFYPPVEFDVEKMPEENGRDENGFSRLHYATILEDVEKVGEELNKLTALEDYYSLVDKHGCFPLYYCVHGKRKKDVASQYLSFFSEKGGKNDGMESCNVIPLKKKKLDKNNSYNNLAYNCSILQLAILAGDYEMVKKYLEYGAYPRFKLATNESVRDLIDESFEEPNKYELLNLLIDKIKLNPLCIELNRWSKKKEKDLSVRLGELFREKRELFEGLPVDKINYFSANNGNFLSLIEMFAYYEDGVVNTEVKKEVMEILFRNENSMFENKFDYLKPKVEEFERVLNDYSNDLNIVRDQAKSLIEVIKNDDSDRANLITKIINILPQRIKGVKNIISKVKLAIFEERFEYSRVLLKKIENEYLGDTNQVNDLIGNFRDADVLDNFIRNIYVVDESGLKHLENEEDSIYHFAILMKTLNYQINEFIENINEEIRLDSVDEIISEYSDGYSLANEERGNFNFLNEKSRELNSKMDESLRIFNNRFERYRLGQHMETLDNIVSEYKTNYISPQ